MDLKSIDMQIALPRTFDASKLVEQNEYAGQRSSDLASDQMQKEERNKRTGVVKQEQKSEVFNHSNGSSQNTTKQSSSRSLHEVDDESKPHHPYKGLSIDFSG